MHEIEQRLAAHAAKPRREIRDVAFGEERRELVERAVAGSTRGTGLHLTRTRSHHQIEVPEASGESKRIGRRMLPVPVDNEDVLACRGPNAGFDRGTVA